MFYFYFTLGRDRERQDFMISIGAKAGVKRTVQRFTLYDDVIKLYQHGEIIKESPILIVYDSELAVDEGGVTRDVFSLLGEGL